jgi:hypothetical protein
MGGVEGNSRQAGPLEVEMSVVCHPEQAFFAQ